MPKTDGAMFIKLVMGFDCSCTYDKFAMVLAHTLLPAIARGVA